MNNDERELIRYVCEGDIRKAQQQTKILLEGITTEKDRRFKEYNLKVLANKGPELIELPPNLKGILVAEDATVFPENRFLLRKREAEVVQKVLSVRRAADSLRAMQIEYLPAAILYGVSGTGKTMLARYIAHCANLPFVYVRFSGLIDSLLGGTQGKLNRVFDYANANPCVLCLDELDCIGMCRGQKDDVGEMNRIVISLMQELDAANSKCILIGTTNRYDSLDSALCRRFPINSEVLSLSKDESIELMCKYLSSIDMIPSQQEEETLISSFGNTPVAARVVENCKQYVVDRILQQNK